MPVKKKMGVKVGPPKKRVVLSTADDDLATSEPRSPSPPPPPPPPPEPEVTEATAPDKKKRKQVVILTDVQEVELADWMKEHPFLFTKTMKQYKDTAKKNDLWIKKADELRVDLAMLRTWYESIRTKVGKITDKKSGSAAREMTDRDTFIITNFDFLAKHISRVKGKPAYSLKSRLESTASAAVSSDSEMDHDDAPIRTDSPPPVIDPNESVHTLGSQNSTAAEPASTLKGKSSARSRAKNTRTPLPSLDDSAEVVNLIDSLNKQQERAESIQGHITGILNTRDQNSSAAIWGSWLGSMAADLHPSVMPRFYRASFDLVMGFAQESKQLQQTIIPMTLDQQQPQQHPQQQSLQQQPPQPLQQPHPQPQPQQNQTFTSWLTSEPESQQLQGYFGRDSPANWDTVTPSSSSAQPPRPVSTPASFLMSNFSDLTHLTPSPVIRQDSSFNQ